PVRLDEPPEERAEGDRGPDPGRRRPPLRLHGRRFPEGGRRRVSCATTAPAAWLGADLAAATDWIRPVPVAAIPGCGPRPAGRRGARNGALERVTALSLRPLRCRQPALRAPGARGRVEQGRGRRERGRGDPRATPRPPRAFVRRLLAQPPG